eukprot:scaffold9588_cov134-Skeletonema_marinoi.AAC.3
MVLLSLCVNLVFTVNLVGCCLESLGVTSGRWVPVPCCKRRAGLYNASWQLKSRYEHGASMHRRTRTPKLYVAPMYVGGGRYWGHVRRNPFGMTDGRTVAL